MKPHVFLKWGVLWRSQCRLDGRREYLCGEGYGPVLFKTRQEARDYLENRYGYIRDRADLRAEPYGYKMPRVVPVRVTMTLVRP